MKAFSRWYVLTDSDLMIELYQNGEPVLATDISCRVYWVHPSTGIRHELRLNGAIIRQTGNRYWLDAKITANVAPGEYQIEWCFRTNGTQRVVTDEFCVLR